MIIVSNTSPIVNLAAIGQLELLEKMFQKILIPQAVYHEIVIAGEGQPGAHEVQSLGWIETKSVSNWALVTALCQKLDRGEAEAIALTIEENAITFRCQIYRFAWHYHTCKTARLSFSSQAINR